MSQPHAPEIFSRISYSVVYFRTNTHTCKPSSSVGAKLEISAIIRIAIAEIVTKRILSCLIGSTPSAHFRMVNKF